MKFLFSSANTSELSILKDLLNESGIASEIRNEYSNLPGAAFYPELWILNDDDFSKALELYSNSRPPPTAPSRHKDHSRKRSNQEFRRLLDIILSGVTGSVLIIAAIVCAFRLWWYGPTITFRYSPRLGQHISSPEIGLVFLFGIIGAAFMFRAIGLVQELRKGRRIDKKPYRNKKMKSER